MQNWNLYFSLQSLLLSKSVFCHQIASPSTQLLKSKSRSRTGHSRFPLLHPQSTKVLPVPLPKPISNRSASRPCHCHRQELLHGPLQCSNPSLCFPHDASHPIQQPEQDCENTRQTVIDLFLFSTNNRLFLILCRTLGNV